MIKSDDLQIGNIVKLHKYQPAYKYSWHVEYPEINYIGIIVDIIEGYRYSLIWIKIAYPLNGKKDWSKGTDYPDKRENTWEYDVTCIKEIVDLNKLEPEAYEYIVGMLL